MNSLNILVWNCRGVGNSAFKRNMRELISTHKPERLILMETKVPFSSMGNYFNNMGFTAATIVDTIGRAGGIWLLWDTAHVSIRASHATNQVIQATIHKEDYEEWILSAVYASPHPSQGDELWNNLEETTRSMEKPWLVAVDFNDYTNHNERRSFSPHYNHNRTQKFAERINNCMHPSTPTSRPFRFEAAWLCHPSFSDVVKKSWTNMDSNLVEAINGFTHDVKNWNKEVFGNVYKRKRNLLAQIEGIQKSQTHGFSHNLHLLENNLIKQYNMTLFQEELIWFQKSKVKWLTMGDRNTKFFHISTLNKCRKLKINMIKDSAGNWLSNSENIKNHIIQYFNDLFKHEVTPMLDNWKSITHTGFTQDNNVTLQAPITNHEIWNAIKNIKAFKAPGRDGLQAVFFHQNWNIVGPSMCNFVKQCFSTQTIPEEVNAK
ncbi:uncharacterized protein LOC114310648 [Camellia sinensis]|uniref:uncharacterized protein LOC114310648 n=1 Tax=Camellia sinensis TaxID=4442 RepID=UPI0010356AB5|nr:uncharacterized protein LOC114310648 [Camellia sinensis]